MKAQFLFLGLLIIIFIGACNRNTVSSYADSSLDRTSDFESFDWIGDYSENLALVRQQQDFFVVDTKGEKQFDWSYDGLILEYKNGYSSVSKKGYYGIIDKKGNIIAPFKFDFVGSRGFEFEVVPVKLNNISGVYSIQNKKFHPIGREVLEVLSEDRLIVSCGRLSGIVDLDGNTVQKMEHYNIQCNQGYYTFQKDKKIGIKHINGKIVVPNEFDDLRIDKELRYFSAERNGKEAILSIKNEILIPFEYSSIASFKNHFIVSKGNKNGLVNIRNEILIPVVYDNLQVFTNRDVIIAKKNNKKGIFDKDGNQLTKVEYDEISNLYNRFYHLKSDSLNQVYKVKDGSFTSVQFEEINSFNKGRARAILDGEFVYVDTSFIVSDYAAGNVLDTIIASDGQAYLTNLNYPLYGYFHVVSEDGKYGLIDKTYKIIHPVIYDKAIGVERYGFELMLDEYFGMINHKGDTIVPFQHKTNPRRPWNKYFSGSRELCDINGVKRLVDLNNGIVFDTAYQSFSSIGPNSMFPNLIRVTESNNLEWIHDLNRSSKSPKKYRKLGETFEHLISVQNDGGNWGLIRFNGESVLPLEYDSFEFLRKYIIGRKGDTYTVVNTTGDIMFDAECDYLKEIIDDKFIMKKNGFYGMINVAGEEIIPFQFNHIKFNNNQKYITALNRKYGVFLLNGKEIIPFEYDQIRVFNDEFFIVRKEDKYGVINSQNEVVVPVKYQFIEESGRDKKYLKIQDNGKYGLLDQFFNEVLPSAYNKVKVYSEYLELQKDQKYGLASIKGKVILPTEYSQMLNIKSGYIWAKKELWGLLDTLGNQLLPHSYTDIEDVFTFGGNFTKVKIDDKSGLIRVSKTNGTAREFLPPLFDHIYKLGYNNYILAKSKNEYVLFDENGVCVKNCLFYSDLESQDIDSSNVQVFNEEINIHDSLFEGTWIVLFSDENEKPLYMKLKNKGDRLIPDKIVHRDYYYKLEYMPISDVSKTEKNLSVNFLYGKIASNLLLESQSKDKLEGRLRVEIEASAKRAEKLQDNISDSDFYIGKWDLNLEHPDSRTESTLLEIKREGGKLFGEIQNESREVDGLILDNINETDSRIEFEIQLKNNSDSKTLNYVLDRFDAKTLKGMMYIVVHDMVAIRLD